MANIKQPNKREWKKKNGTWRTSQPVQESSLLLFKEMKNSEVRLGLGNLWEKFGLRAFLFFYFLVCVDKPLSID